MQAQLERGVQGNPGASGRRQVAVPAGVVLRLLVRNHPGVMSHICGLFARRAFNVEGIVCLPADDVAGGARSVVLLLVNKDQRLEQLVRQLAKLEDVLEIGHDAGGNAAFTAVAGCL
ncbi:MAG: ACT domain-containing protein [Deltaproteobacteria bacterium]|nr:ACT domain-containing protein [Deltaproteobacteria bacterium]